MRPFFGPRFFPVPVFHYNAGSYLQGAASVIDAQGQFLRNVQGANLLREQVRVARLDTRRRVWNNTCMRGPIRPRWKSTWSFVASKRFGEAGTTRR